MRRYNIDCPKGVSFVNDFDNCCMLLPSRLRASLCKHIEAEEFRLRCGHPVSVVVGGKELFVNGSFVNEDDIVHILELASGASLHSSATCISNGYITYKGIRIGLCGQAIYKDGQIMGFNKYSSLSLRIPHEIKGMLPREIHEEISLRPQNLLIAAPPGFGKTSALRELVRLVSDKGVRVSLIDERGELAGVEHNFVLGKCTDVLTGVPKALATIMLLRSMNPQIIAMDEISSTEDIDAVFESAGCGVVIFATVHGRELEDMLCRPAYFRMLNKGIFHQLLSIKISNGNREYKLERINL